MNPLAGLHSGHPNDLEIGRPIGAKIGQTDSGLDSWTVGYTPSMLVAVWTGVHTPNSRPPGPPGFNRTLECD